MARAQRNWVSLDMQVTGVRRMVKSLAKISGEAVARDSLLDALEKGAGPVQVAAVQKAPKRTGRLRRSIKTVRDRGTKRKGPAVRVGSSLPYAHLQEFGARHHGATPFLQPALDEKRAEAVRIVRDELARAIERAVR